MKLRMVVPLINCEVIASVPINGSTISSSITPSTTINRGVEARMIYLKVTHDLFIQSLYMALFNRTTQ